MFSLSSILMDVVFLVIIAIGLLIGYKRGGVTIIFSFCSLLLSAYLSYVLYDPVANFTAKVFLDTDSDIKDKIIVKIIVLLVLFMFLSFALGILVKILNKIISFSLIGKLNKILGASIGALSGAVIVYILCFAISIALKKDVGLPFGLTNADVDNSILFSIFM